MGKVELTKETLLKDLDLKQQMIDDLGRMRDKDQKMIKDLFEQVYNLEKEDRLSKQFKNKLENERKNVEKRFNKKSAEVDKIKMKESEKEKKLRESMGKMKDHINKLNQ